VDGIGQARIGKAHPLLQRQNLLHLVVGNEAERLADLFGDQVLP